MSIVYNKNQGSSIKENNNREIKNLTNSLKNQNNIIKSFISASSNFSGKGISKATEFLKIYSINNKNFISCLENFDNIIKNVDTDFQNVSNEHKVDVPKWETDISSLVKTIDKINCKIENCDKNDKKSYNAEMQLQNDLLKNMKCKREKWIEDAKTADSKKINDLDVTMIELNMINNNFDYLNSSLTEDGEFTPYYNDNITMVQNSNNYFMAKKEYKLNNQDIIRLQSNGITTDMIGTGYSCIKTKEDKKFFGYLLKEKFGNAFSIDLSKLSSGMQGYEFMYYNEYVNANKNNEDKIIKILNALSCCDYTKNYDASEQYKHLNFLVCMAEKETKILYENLDIVGETGNINKNKEGTDDIINRLNNISMPAIITSYLLKEIDKDIDSNELYHSGFISNDINYTGKRYSGIKIIGLSRLHIDKTPYSDKTYDEEENVKYPKGCFSNEGIQIKYDKKKTDVVDGSIMKLDERCKKNIYVYYPKNTKGLLAAEQVNNIKSIEYKYSLENATKQFINKITDDAISSINRETKILVDIMNLRDDVMKDVNQVKADNSKIKSILEGGSKFYIFSPDDREIIELNIRGAK